MFAGGHEKVIAAVLKGEADAGAVYEGAIAVEKSKGVPTENLVTLASTDLIPHDAITVGVGLDDALAKKILAALVGLEKSEVGRRVIANSKPKKLNGYLVAKDTLYDVVRRTAKIAGMPGL
jgi:ABC-type phosphate/phosphonate transport system substrate-binding protein